MSRRDELQHLVKTTSATEDPRLSVAEIVQVRLGGASPGDYVALPVQLQVDQGQVDGKPKQGVIVNDPQGERVIVLPLLLAIPLKHVKVSRVLGADGQSKNPLEGMLPSLFGRLVVPRARLTDEVLAQVDAAAQEFAEQAVDGADAS